MSIQNNTFTRRHFLKGVACTSAISIGGISGIAAATSLSPDQYTVSGPLLSTVTLMNQSAQSVALDAKQPVSLEKVNGWVVLKINKAASHGKTLSNKEALMLSAGERIPFVIDTELAGALSMSGEEIVITNDFSTQDNMVPLSTYNTSIA